MLFNRLHSHMGEDRILCELIDRKNNRGKTDQR
jgi:hypothetical protein